MEQKAKTARGFAALAAIAALALGCTGAQAQDKTLTLCWAAWDPANALVELSKDFTAQTGVKMKFEFVPWTSYADRFLNELNSHSKLCDLIIGDSQWIGGSPKTRTTSSSTTSSTRTASR
jgi:multiple sugar transport system substrate-binding protein